MHVPPRAEKKIGAKFTGRGGSCKCPTGRECTPRQSKSPIFKSKLGDMGGGRGYLGSFSVCFEGDD